MIQCNITVFYLIFSETIDEVENSIANARLFLHKYIINCFLVKLKIGF